MKVFKNPKGFVITLSVVLVIALVGGGIYLYANRNSTGNTSMKAKNKHAPTIKPGTKGPTITSPNPITPADTVSGQAPKAAN